MRIAGRGEVEVWEGASLWVLTAETGSGEADWHAHHAIQVTFSLEGRIKLRTATDTLEAPALAVAADAQHAFSASGKAAFLFIEPESPAGRALSSALFKHSTLAAVETGNLCDLLGSLREQPEAYRQEAGYLRRIGTAVIERLACTCAIGASDHRVAAMIDYASANLDKPISLARATTHIGLSPSRLRHLFAQETGLAFKTYVLWLRMRRALDLYAGGASLTHAAHEAGFADSAHLSRTFRRTFGVPATALRIEGGAGRDA